MRRVMGSMLVLVLGTGIAGCVGPDEGQAPLEATGAATAVSAAPDGPSEVVLHSSRHPRSFDVAGGRVLYAVWCAGDFQCTFTLPPNASQARLLIGAEEPVMPVTFLVRQDDQVVEAQGEVIVLPIAI